MPLRLWRTPRNYSPAPGYTFPSQPDYYMNDDASQLASNNTGSEANSLLTPTLQSSQKDLWSVLRYRRKEYTSSSDLRGSAKTLRRNGIEPSFEPLLAPVAEEAPANTLSVEPRATTLEQFKPSIGRDNEEAYGAGDESKATAPEGLGTPAVASPEPSGDSDPVSPTSRTLAGLPAKSHPHEQQSLYENVQRSSLGIVILTTGVARIASVDHEHQYTSWTLRDADGSDDDSGHSSVTSQVGSIIFSEAPFVSKATDLSAGSAYSAFEIAMATREMLDIFLEDVILGAERLKRHLTRMLKNFAKSLKCEITNQLEKLVVRLVSSKASYIAHSIIERFEVKASKLQGRRSEEDESSDEEEDENPVDEERIDDLAACREFLTEASAFEILETHVQSFVRPTLAEARDNAELNSNGENMRQHIATAEREPDCRSLWQRTQRTLRDVFVVAGYMEPPLNPDWSRLRWRCRYGNAFWSDVMEYRPGGINRAIQRMEQATGSKVTVTSHNKHSTNQNWSFNMPRWTQSFLPGARSGSNKTPKLPQHNPPIPISTQTTLATAGLSPPSGVSIRLLACIHRTQERKLLLQEPIDEVNNDLSLFLYMKRQLRHHRGRLHQLLSLRSVRGIHFVKVYLRTGNLVEVREHSLYCVSSQSANTSTRVIPCDCIPPEPKREPAPNAEYRCIVDDLDTGAGPPVNPTFLLHMLNSTDCISKDSKSIFNILPRRICGQLQGGDLKPAVGWGIYYEEGLDADMIISVMFTIVLLGSVLFGILWSVLKLDIQGAFGVSSYMMTASGIIIAWIATRAKNYG